MDQLNKSKWPRNAQISSATRRNGEQESGHPPMTGRRMNQGVRQGKTQMSRDEELEEYMDPGFNEDDSSAKPPCDIVAYNELRSCAELARMTEEGTINLQADFQRGVVWKSADQTRFVDSLVKQLPIPSMCFAFDHTSDTWIVVDGLQRMTSIVKFSKGGEWRLSRLDDIDERLSGKVAASCKTGSGEAKKIFNRVQNRTLPIAVLRCEFKKQNHWITCIPCFIVSMPVVRNSTTKKSATVFSTARLTGSFEDWTNFQVGENSTKWRRGKITV